MIDFPPLAGWPAEIGLVRIPLPYPSDILHVKGQKIQVALSRLPSLLISWDKFKSPGIISSIGDQLQKLRLLFHEITLLAKKENEAQKLLNKLFPLIDFLEHTKKSIDGKEISLFEAAKKPLELTLVLTYIHTHDPNGWNQFLSLLNQFKSLF